jgi:hypothetical protein
MRIVSKEAVWDVKWNGDSLEYDKKLSTLCTDGQHFLVVNPELDYDVLELINVNVPLNDYCVKFKVGEGWIAKRFPGIWNGKYQIVQLQIKPLRTTFKDYAEKDLTYYQPVMDAWDLKYSQTWTYDKSLTDGADIDAVIFDYTAAPVGRKVQGIAPVNNNFDVIFLSYNENKAQDNWNRLLNLKPNAKRVDGVKGILNAHKVAAELAHTDMFYVIDADAYILDNFKFDHCPSIFNRKFIHVWYSRNPINDLEYGYGGVKLFPKQLLLEINSNPLDVTTSLGSLKIIDQVACETRFNTDPFSTWKSAFRECVKLSSKLINKQVDQETNLRLETWINVGIDREYGLYAQEGARMGEAYGRNFCNDLEALRKINDYEWLLSEYRGRYEQ